MPYYELLCLASGRLARKDLSSVLRKACRAFMDNGGTVTRLVPLGADGNGPRPLAYKIRRHQQTYDKGFFINVCAFASPATVEEVSRVLKIEDRILRHSFYKRPFMDCLRRIPDVDDIPDLERSMDPGDPDYELQKFLTEFKRDFPDGIVASGGPKTVSNENTASPSESPRTTSNEAIDAMAAKQEQDSVLDMLAQLKRSPSTKSQGSSGRDGLAWLSDMNKSDDPSDRNR